MDYVTLLVLSCHCRTVLSIDLWKGEYLNFVKLSWICFLFKFHHNQVRCLSLLFFPRYVINKKKLIKNIESHISKRFHVFIHVFFLLCFYMLILDFQYQNFKICLETYSLYCIKYKPQGYLTCVIIILNFFIGFIIKVQLTI